MDRTTFLKNYRIRRQYDGTPHEPDRNGPIASYEGIDERTAEPVSVTLMPIQNVDAEERDRFEEYASAAQKLHHVNIAQVLDFGREGDDYVYVSERLAGETLASWVRSHGPMPADAALRVAEQIVSVLSSAGFHKFPYPPIQPSDVMLVPGQTAEGTWPLVKVTNFGLPELTARPEPQPIESSLPDTAGTKPNLGDQQFGLATADIRSEIYSLGVTLYFLVSGIALSTDELRHGPTFSGFPKPLRSLLGKLLHRDPDRRPKDLLVVTELIRESLGKIERRRALSDRYGLPLRTSVPRPRKARPRLLLRTAIVVGVLLLLAAAIAPMLFPYAIGKFVHDIQKPKEIGVLVGVPDPSVAASQPSSVAQTSRNNSAAPPAIVSRKAANPAGQPETSGPSNAAITPNPFHVAPADVEQAQIATAQPQQSAGSVQPQSGGSVQPQSAGSTNSSENAAAAPDASAAADVAANSSTQTSPEPPPSTAPPSTSRSTERSVASKSKRAHPGQSSDAYSSQGRTRLMRSRVTGITSDGRLILRLPSGRTAIVAPDEGVSRPRHRNRVYIDRDQMFGPPPGFGSEFPGD
jgi:hypothetical protein